MFHYNNLIFKGSNINETSWLLHNRQPNFTLES